VNREHTHSSNNWNQQTEGKIQYRKFEMTEIPGSPDIFAEQDSFLAFQFHIRSTNVQVTRPKSPNLSSRFPGQSNA
jgi:hypothetical protein